MTKKNDTFIVTVDDDDNINVIDSIEMEKYRVGASKAKIDPATGSKQVPEDNLVQGNHVLEPRYNPQDLVDLLDLYSYHANCVDVVSTDAAGISYDLQPVKGIEPVEKEKVLFNTILKESKPSINVHLKRCAYDRRTLGYGAIEVIRDSTSKSPITRFKHIPAHTLKRTYDQKRVQFRDNTGKEVWYVIYGKNYTDDGTLCDVHSDTGEFYPYNSLTPEERANELLWTFEYAPGTDYYGRPPVVGALPSIQGDLSAVQYNISFFKNMGMPKFAVTVTGDFQEYDEEPYIEDDDGNKVPNPAYDEKETLRYKISEQIKQVIKHPHSALCITIPSEGDEGKVEVKIIPLSVHTEEGHFRMYRKDNRDEVIHSHQVDPSRLGIFDAGNLNGTNSDNTRESYKYGTIAPIKADLEAMVNQTREEIGALSWEFKIVEVIPVDNKDKKELADFLFERGALTINDLIRAFGEEFGVDPDENNQYMNSRYIKGVPLEKVWNSNENNPYAEVDSIFNDFERKLRNENNNDDDGVVDDNNSNNREATATSGENKPN